MITNDAPTENIYNMFTLGSNRKWHKLGILTEILHSNDGGILSFLETPARTVVVTTVLEPPFTVLHPSSNILNEDSTKCVVGKLCWKYETKNLSKIKIANCCVGYCIDMLLQMEIDLDVNTEVYLVEDSMFGAVVNGTWVGLIGDIVRRKAEIAIGSITINEKRSIVVDFTDPFMAGGLSIATVNKKHLIPFFNNAAFSPLSSMLWFTVFAIILVCSFMLYISERLICLGINWKYSLTDSITYLSGLLFQRDIGGLNPRCLGSRTISIVFAIFTMIIMSTYSAVLTANAVTHETQPSVTGFDDVKVPY